MVDAVSGASVRWQPAPMVLPVSQSLKDRVATEEYEAAVDAALRNLDFTLLGPSAN